MSDLKRTLEAIFTHDAEFISKRDAHYESSWKARGGPGAFFTIARPWDRFAAIAGRGIIGIAGRYSIQPWDIFGIIEHEQAKGLTEDNDGTLQACIRDLRAYMALLAAEAVRMRTTYRQDQCSASPSPKEPAAKWTNATLEMSPIPEEPPLRKQLMAIYERRNAKVPTTSDSQDINHILRALLAAV